MFSTFCSVNVTESIADLLFAVALIPEIAEYTANSNIANNRLFVLRRADHAVVISNFTTDLFILLLIHIFPDVCSELAVDYRGTENLERKFKKPVL